MMKITKFDSPQEKNLLLQNKKEINSLNSVYH